MQRRSALKLTAAAALVALTAACGGGSTGPGTITNIVASNDDFSRLNNGIKAAELSGTLSSEGPFTVFAPTDDAVAKLPQGRLDAARIFNESDRSFDKATTRNLLLYHVVPGAITSDQLAGRLVEVQTVQGDTLIIDGRSGGKYGATVTVNDANVIAADILASNGVIHVIDTVLIPKTGPGVQ